MASPSPKTDPASESLPQTVTLWLIGGTQESAQLATALGEHPNCVITVTTARAKQLYAHTPCPILVTRLTLENIGAFIQHYHISKILDVSHPHAAAISQLAIQCSQDYHLPYLRYERPALVTNDSGCYTWANLTQLLTQAKFQQERILVTLGYRQLPILKNFWGEHTWFVRIIPDQIALATALETGFLPQQIIALWPPRESGFGTSHLATLGHYPGDCQGFWFSRWRRCEAGIGAGIGSRTAFAPTSSDKLPPGDRRPPGGTGVCPGVKH